MTEDEIHTRAETATDALIDAIAEVAAPPTIVILSLSAVLVALIRETARKDRPLATFMIADLIGDLEAMDTEPDRKH